MVTAGFLAVIIAPALIQTVSELRDGEMPLALDVFLKPPTARNLHAYEKSLKDLETWLGNDHNLAVLRGNIVIEPAFYGTKEDTHLMLDLIDRYQTELGGASISLAERIYAEKPREFVARMQHLWDAWKQQPVSLEQSSTAA